MYKGYHNQATWVVALWSQKNNEIMDRVAQATNDAWPLMSNDDEDSLMTIVSEYIEDIVVNQEDCLTELMQSLLNAAFAEVDYSEVARVLVNEALCDRRAIAEIEETENGLKGGL